MEGALWKRRTCKVIVIVITDDQIAEMASLNFTALELSLFSRKKQRSKKIKTLYNCIWDQILSGTPTEE